MPLKPFPIPPKSDSTLEVCEFLGSTDRDVYPFTTFINHIFIYPLVLNFDNQKLFSRARNIAVIVELRDSDADGTKPLPVRIYLSIRMQPLAINTIILN